MDFVKKFTVTKEENSQVKIEGEIPFEALEKHRAKAIKAYGKDMEIDGFRKGHVPDTEVIKYQTGYQQIEIDFINQHIGRKIRVKMLDGKEYEGLLSSATEYNLELTQNLAGGEVNYPLMLNEIQTFEAWINQEQ